MFIVLISKIFSEVACLPEGLDIFISKNDAFLYLYNPSEGLILCTEWGLIYTVSEGLLHIVNPLSRVRDCCQLIMIFTHDDWHC